MFGFVVCGMVQVGFLGGCVFECFQACMWLLCGCCLFCGVGCFDALVVDGFGGLGFWALTPGLRECWVGCYVFGWSGFLGGGLLD